MRKLDLQNSYKVYTAQFKKSDTIVIDNGTYEFKAGYLGSGVGIKFLNCFYKDTEGLKFDSIRTKNKYTPFTFDMISGFHVLEENIDQALEYLEVKKCNNLIITDAIYSPTKLDLIRFLFEVYHFNKIQIGVDAVYSYLYNINYTDNQRRIIISLGHSASYVYIIKKEEVLDVYKINYGGKFALMYLTNIIKYKFKEYNKNYMNIMKYLKCPLDYDKEVFEIIERLKLQDFSDSVCINEAYEEIKEDSVMKSRLVERLKNMNKKKNIKRPKYESSDELDNNLEEINDSTNLDEQTNLNDEQTNLDETLENEDLEKIGDEIIKLNDQSNFPLEKKVMPGMLKIRLYQYNNKILKILRRLDNKIKENEEEYEKITDLPSFLNKKKKRYEHIIRELELREKVRKDSTNRKTYEFGLLLKTGELTKEEIEYKKKIKKCENTNIDEKLINERDSLLEIISLYDKNYISSKSTVYDLVSNKHTENILVNIDLLRVTEVLFEPSLIGSDQMGLGEILENILEKYRDINEIFLTGGFSQIQGLKERLKQECKKYSYDKEIRIKTASNPEEDPLKGMRYSEMFETYTYEEYTQGKYN